ncbi:MAG: hypothetical protein M1840_002568 [Geoglossum simile]|nr:MAG: hypothetical protein M1840_002568 [Geoglossum simile]
MASSRSPTPPNRMDETDTEGGGTSPAERQARKNSRKRRCLFTDEDGDGLGTPLAGRRTREAPTKPKGGPPNDGEGDQSNDDDNDQSDDDARLGVDDTSYRKHISTTELHEVNDHWVNKVRLHNSAIAFLKVDTNCVDRNAPTGQSPPTIS